MKDKIVLMRIILLGCWFVLCTVGGCCAIDYIQKPHPYSRLDMPFLMPAHNAPDKLGAIVRLHDAKTGEFFCSGSVIASNYVVTAGHCLEGRDDHKVTISVRAADGVDIGIGGVAAFSEGRSDQGLVTGDFSKFNALELEVRPIPELQIYLDPSKVTIACGYPYAGELFCAAFMNRHPYYFSMIGEGFLYPGMSGGPVIDLETGRIIGVNTAATDSGILISPVLEILAHAHVTVAK